MRRARRNRGRAPKRFGWIATLVEGLVDGVADFLTSWRP